MYTTPHACACHDTFEIMGTNQSPKKWSLVIQSPYHYSIFPVCGMNRELLHLSTPYLTVRAVYESLFLLSWTSLQMCQKLETWLVNLGLRLYFSQGRSWSGAFLFFQFFGLDTTLLLALLANYFLPSIRTCFSGPGLRLASLILSSEMNCRAPVTNSPLNSVGSTTLRHWRTH